ILFDFFGGIAVNHVPVAGCDDGHAFDGKILVDFIKSCCRTGTSAADDSSANFSAEISAVKSSVQERNQGTCRRSEVYGCTEYKAVCISSFFKEFVDTVVAEASVRFFTVAAVDASSNRIVAQPEDFCFNAVLFQSVCDFTQCCICAAFFMRTAV